MLSKFEYSMPAEVKGTSGNPASGRTRVIIADGKKYLRYENFKTINGSDIFVYPSKDLEAKEYIDLDRVRATEGNINYEIPENIDPRDYSSSHICSGYPSRHFFNS